MYALTAPRPPPTLTRYESSPPSLAESTPHAEGRTADREGDRPLLLLREFNRPARQDPKISRADRPRELLPARRRALTGALRGGGEHADGGNGALRGLALRSARERARAPLLLGRLFFEGGHHVLAVLLVVRHLHLLADLDLLGRLDLVGDDVLRAVFELDDLRRLVVALDLALRIACPRGRPGGQQQSGGKKTNDCTIHEPTSTFLCGVNVNGPGMPSPDVRRAIAVPAMRQSGGPPNAAEQGDRSLVRQELPARTA